MSRVPWHLRYLRALIYLLLAPVILGIAFASTLDVPDVAHTWIAARQLYGLWALSLLLASMLPGPLIFVLPWFPFKAHLIMARRALGVSSFVMAACHVVCYLGPTLLRDWHDLFTPGKLWIAGLAFGLPALADLAALAVTSGDRALRRMGPRRWKQWHQTVYVLLPVVLIHATFLGADFGVNKGPDVSAEVDAGCLITMLLLSLAWMVLFLLRHKKVRWAPAIFQRNKTPRPEEESV